MPFGIRNAPQRLMDNVLSTTKKYALFYIDDISVFSSTWQDHLYHLCSVFQKIEQAGLTLQIAKRKLGSTSCKFLGHNVGTNAISPQQAKVNAVVNCKCPRTKKDARSFLGLAGYYRPLSQNFSSIATSLLDLTPDYTKTFVFQTDSSDIGIGAVLSQGNGKE